MVAYTYRMYAPHLNKKVLYRVPTGFVVFKEPRSRQLPEITTRRLKNRAETGQK